MNHENERGERRKNGGFTDAQIEAITDAVFERIYDRISLQIGRSLISKGLWILGAASTAVLAWLHGAGKIPFFGSGE